MKNLTKIGILAFIFSLLIVYNNSLNFQNSFSTPAVHQVIVTPQNTTIKYIQLDNSTVFGLLYYTDGNAVNFALANASGEAPATHYISSGTRPSSANNSGYGIMEMSYNSIYDMFPYQQSNGTGTTYYSTQSPILPPGNYALIFYDPANTPVQVLYSIATKPQYQVNNTLVSTAAYGIIGALLFFGGIIVILYSVFIKRDSDSSKGPGPAPRESPHRARARQASGRKPKRSMRG